MKVLVHLGHLRGYWWDWDITLPKEHLVLLAEHPVAKEPLDEKWGLSIFCSSSSLSDWDGDIIPHTVASSPSDKSFATL